MLSKPQGIVPLEGLGKLEEKKIIDLIGSLATFRLVPQCLNQVRYRMPLRTFNLHFYFYILNKTMLLAIFSFTECRSYNTLSFSPHFGA
jgi:hypothetical protein